MGAISDSKTCTRYSRYDNVSSMRLLVGYFMLCIEPNLRETGAVWDSKTKLMMIMTVFHGGTMLAKVRT